MGDGGLVILEKCGDVGRSRVGWEMCVGKRGGRGGTVASINILANDNVTYIGLKIKITATIQKSRQQSQKQLQQQQQHQ